MGWDVESRESHLSVIMHKSNLDCKLALVGHLGTAQLLVTLKVIETNPSTSSCNTVFPFPKSLTGSLLRDP